MSLAFGESLAFYLEDQCPLGPVSAHEGSTDLDIETIFPLKVIFLHRPVGGVVAAAQATIGPVPLIGVLNLKFERLLL